MAPCPPKQRSKSDGGLSIGAWALIASVFGLSALAGIITVYDAVFPVRPTAIKASDAAAVSTLFSSGAPAVFMCINGTSFNERASKTIEDAYREHWRKEGIAAYTLDCTQSVKGGASVAERYKLAMGYSPVWGAVAYGRKPTQLSPGLAGNSDALAKEAIRAVGANKAMKIGNRIDLASCIRDRSGGCLIVYTGRKHAEVSSADVPALLQAHPAVKFATLNASALKLAAPSGSPLHRVLSSGVAAAREAALAAEVRGEVLVLAKRVPTPGGGGASLLVTVGHTARPGSVTPADVSALAAKAKRAAEALVPAPGVDPLEALVEREDVLERLGAALVGLGASESLTIDRAQSPAQVAAAAARKAAQSSHAHAGAPGQQAAAAQQGGATAADLKAAHHRRRVAKEGQQQQQEGAGGAAGDASGGDGEGEEEEGDGLTPGERERRRREAMAAEEAESAFVAHAADGDEGDDDAGEAAGNSASSGSGGGAVEEEVVDLDALGDDDSGFGDDSESGAEL